MRNARIAALYSLLISAIAFPTFAQVTLTDPPDSTPSRGLSATGQYALSQIESINASTGNLSLSIPLAHLPPGPAGFSAGVNLAYNSTLYDIEIDAPGTQQQYRYASSLHGGGWNYGYRYTLWTQRRFAQDFDLSNACNAIGTTSAAAWFKNYLETPDGSNHVLNLVATIDPSGQVVTSPPSASIKRDPNDAYWQYDFGGNTTQSCLNSLFNGQQAARFHGTLVFATSDSTYIRVEATVNNGSGSWVAYLPDGTQINPVAGASIGSTGGHVNDSDGTQVTDRNGNTLTLSGGCPNGGACTESLTDSQSRSISIEYTGGAASTCPDLSSDMTAWTDTITWPGINGDLTTNVNWACAAPDSSIKYYNLVNSDGSTYTNSGVGDQIDLQPNLNPLPAVVTSVQLPGASTGGLHTTFTFGYGSWGEVHSLAMSSGGTQQYNVAYTYCYDVGISCSLVTSPRPPATAVNPIKSKELDYTELRDGDSSNSSPRSETTNYAILGPSNAFTYPQTGTVGNVTNPDGSWTQIYTANLCVAGFKSRDFCPALPYKIVNSDGSQTEMGWASNTPPGGVPSSAIFNPYVQYRAFTAANSATKEASIVQDQNGNATLIKEYDWIPSANVPRNANTNIVNGTACPQTGAPNYGSPCPLRTTSNSYYEQSGSAYWSHSASRNLRAKQTAAVGDVTTEYTYDAALTTANLTQLKQYDATTNITSHWTYFGNGNISTMTDPNGNLTVICYDTNGLYPVKKVVAAQPNASCPNPAAFTEGRTTTYNFDFNSGLLKSVTDADNSVTTNNSAFDDLGRVKTSTQTGGSFSRTTDVSYDDANLSVTTTSDDTSTRLVTTVYQDALGRVRYALDGASNKVQKAYRYGSSGSFVVYELESNAYNGGSSDSQTMGWTLTTRNLSTLTTTVKHFQGSTPPAPWDTNTTVSGSVTIADGVSDASCAGPVTTITDEAANVRKNCLDALGRLVSVTEPNSTVTTYTYDALDNLLTVDMNGQPTINCPDSTHHHMRCFSYSLGRLQSATNPENGATITYSYDNNGNLTKQSQTSGTTINFSPYDRLNRLLGKTYTVTDQAAPQPVCYVYDASGFKGALTSVGTLQSGTCSNPVYSTETSYTYDTLGRIYYSTQTTNGTPYTFFYGYSKTDQLTSITYPSYRQIQYGLDEADRVTSVKDVASGTNYATVTYTAPGGIHTLSLRNGLTEQVDWNDRSQPTQMQASKSNNPQLTLNFYPCSSSLTRCISGNNGNLLQQTISVPGMSTLSQTYTYDSLSRLTSAQETGGPSGWSQTYSYDARGNRWIAPGNNVGLGQDQTLETPTASTWYSNSSVINRINGWGYDSAGNLTSIYGISSRSFGYDAENREVSATVNSNTSTYTYDGLGQRVMKVSGGQTTVYVYDAFGNLDAEYTAQAAPSPCGTPTCYLTVDHLGSTRMLTDSNGNTARLYDYLPFGEELLAGQDGRSSLYASSPDALGPKYTGQMWDGETLLYWFNVRHMSGAQGRFQGVDPGNAGANPADPQTWNMYAYVGNNPLSYTDPSGMMACAICVGISSGNPAGIAIGGAVEAGVALWRVFSHLGYSGPPVPNWAGTAWETGPILPPFISGTAADELWGNDLMDCRTSLKGCPPTSASPGGAVRDVAATVRGWGLYFGWGLIHMPLAHDRYDPKGLVLTGPAPENPLPFRLFGTYYCGPGGSGPGGGTVNGACKRHDECYLNAGIDAKGNTNRSITWKPGQVAAAKTCNQALYDDVKNSAEPGATLLQLWLLYGDNYGLLHPGTAVHR